MFGVAGWPRPQHRQEGDVCLIRHLERRAVLWPGFAVVVDPDRGDISVPQPLLHLSNVGLVVTQGGGLAVVAFNRWPFHSLDGVMRDGVLLGQVLEQRGQGREAVSNGHAVQGTPYESITPGDDVGPGDIAKLLRLHDAGELHEVLQGMFVGAASTLVAEIGKPLDFGRHVGQALEVGSREKSGNRCDGRWEVGRRHGDSLLLITAFINREWARKVNGFLSGRLA